MARSLNLRLKTSHVRVPADSLSGNNVGRWLMRVQGLGKGDEH